MLLAMPGLHAQGARSFHGGGVRGEARPGGAARGYAARPGYGYRGGYYGRGGYGRYYFLGGVGYFYPFFGYGFGYPYYAYDGYWNGYAGAPFGYGYGYGDGYGDQGPYEGRVTDGGVSDGPGGPNGQTGANSLPGAVQRQLAKRGYYKGTVNGDFGASSRKALSRFQRDNHLKETGRIDEDTLEALGFTDRR